MPQLRITQQPKQAELSTLWESADITRIGYGGARGGGKSGGVRRIMLLRRMNYPNTTGLILRRSLKELEQSHILKLFEEFPDLRAMYNEQKKTLSLPNGSKLFFGSAPTEKDMADFYSSEYSDIVVDEAQEFSQGELERLSGSNRCTSNDKIVPKMVYCFMPGLSESGIPPRGLDYLRRVFVDHKLKGEEIKRQWKFVQAYAWDNVEWAKPELAKDNVTVAQFYGWPESKRKDYIITRTEYGATLSAITNEALRKAWLDGSWTKFEGIYFTNFDYEAHTKNHADIKVDPWAKYWLSGDWGDYHPACIHLHAENSDGSVVTLDEIWGRHIGERILGQRISAMCAGKKITHFAFSWDAFGKLNKETQKPITDLIADGLSGHIPRPTPADSSPGSRISGWRFMYQMIDSGLWTISRKCEKLIECIPTLLRDMERNTEDVLKMDWSEMYIGDDPADSARYGLQYMQSAPDKPFGIRVRDRLAAIQQQRKEIGLTPVLDPTAIAMMSAKAVAAESKKSQLVPLITRSRFQRHYHN